MFGVGIVLALPITAFLVASIANGPSLIVVAPSVAWILFAVPTAGVVGVAFASLGAWLTWSRRDRND